MNRADKARFLTKLAKRYALRHRGQTTRAVLGLVVVTIVLVVGLGMGESVSVSLSEAALAQYGPVDVSLRSNQPFNVTVANALLGLPVVRTEGVSGVATTQVTGSASNPEKRLAEAFTSVRGVVPGEDRALGPLRTPDGDVLPEPRRGEIVLSRDLAGRLDAGVGDTVVLRVPVPGTFPDLAFERFNLTGVAGAPVPPPLPATTVEVGDSALGMFVAVTWQDQVQGSVTVTATAPSGVAFGNTSAAQPVVLLVEPPLEPGTWTLEVEASRPTPYLGTGAVGYPPPSLAAGAVRIEGRVAGVAADGGRVGVSFRPVALVPLADLQEATGTGGQVTHGYYSVGGDPRAVAAAMERALPDDFEGNVSAVKLDAIEEAERAGADIAGFLLVMGAFTLIAAILLAYALFSALVEERRVELGIARALGLTRGEVAFGMTVEGALYAAAAAVVGLLVGVGLLAAAVYGIGRVSAANDGPPFALHLAPATVTVAFVIGTLVPLLTIGGASLRFARLDPARAIRGIPDDPKGKRRAGYVAAAAVFAAGILLSFGDIGRLVGLPIALAGVAIGLASAGWRKVALLPSAAGVALVVYTLYTWRTFPEEAQELDPIMTLARGAVLALGLSALAVASPVPYDTVARWMSRGRRPPRASFVALRYLVARRTPAGLTMGMIALVVVVVTVMGTLFLLFSAQIPDSVAGYAVIGESPLRIDALPKTLPPDLRPSVARIDFLDRHIEFRDANVTLDGRELEDPWWAGVFLGVSQGFAEANEYELQDRAAPYATDREVWDAVVRGEAIVVPLGATLDESQGLAVGDRVTIKTALGAPGEYVVAGSVRSTFAFGTYMASEKVRAMGFPLGTVAAVRVAPGADPDVVAHRLTDEFADDGIAFTSIPEEARRAGAAAQAAILVFESFLALGLFVGLAATGFLASRAVHERIRDIGTLRALGFEERDVRRVFIAESVTTAALGLLVGLAVGLTVAHSVWWREIRVAGIAFQPPTAVLVGFAACVLGLAALAARNPAKKAAAMPPAIAVRYVE